MIRRASFLPLSFSPCGCFARLMIVFIVLFCLRGGKGHEGCSYKKLVLQTFLYQNILTRFFVKLVSSVGHTRTGKALRLSAAFHCAPAEWFVLCVRNAVHAHPLTCRFSRVCTRGYVCAVPAYSYVCTRIYRRLRVRVQGCRCVCGRTLQTSSRFARVRAHNPARFFLRERV